MSDEPKQSETPRTDAKIIAWESKLHHGLEPCVHIDFARELEREITSLKNTLFTIHCDVECLRDAWIEAQSDGVKELIENIKRHAKPL